MRSPWVAPRARPVFCLFLFAPHAGFVVVFTVFALVVPFAFARPPFARRVFAESSFTSSSFGFDAEDDSDDDDATVALAARAARVASTLVSAFAFAFRFFGNLFAAAAPRPSDERATACSIFRSIPASVLEIFSSMISSASRTTRSRFASASASDVFMGTSVIVETIRRARREFARIRALKRTRSVARLRSRAREDDRRLHRTPRTRNVEFSHERIRADATRRRASRFRRPTSASDAHYAL